MNSSEIKSELNETLRKIGRNVLNFQRMEAMLKFLISRSNVEGTSSTLRNNFKKADKKVSRQPMGNLVNGLFASVYTKQVNKEEDAEEIDEICLKFSFKVELGEDHVKKRKNALSRIVKERNDLIHQKLTELDTQSVESCRNLGEFLDQQAENLKPEYEALRATVTMFRDLSKEALEALRVDVSKQAK